MSPVLQADALDRDLEPQRASGHSSSAEPSTSAHQCQVDQVAMAETGSPAVPDASLPLLPEAQRRWAARSIKTRLEPIRRARHWIAAHPQQFAEAISPNLARSQADTLITELLPLLEAMRFLERNAARLLAPRTLGRRHRPLWLAGVRSEVHRDPLGQILVIGPSNFPLFLPGTHVLQALVAGNAVTWKPGEGGEPVARLLAQVLAEAGLPRGILRVTTESVEAAQSALAQHTDKVVFTGSFDTGRKILGTLAETATPAVIELSGADAVVVLPSADLALAARALAFGLRLNGAEVCMSPRRVIATAETLTALKPLLQRELLKIDPVPLKPRTAETLRDLLRQALAEGASQLPLQDAASPRTTSSIPPAKHATTLPATGTHASENVLRPILLDHATPQMAITQTDLFAPVLSLIQTPSTLHIPDLVNNNPYGLTAAVFGAPSEAAALAAQLRAGTVLINDLIAPTVDPRVPFGGRGRSGFGSTRGEEGLLEMTAAKVILTRRKGMARQYDPLYNEHAPAVAALIGLLHGPSLQHRWHSLTQLIQASRRKPNHH